MEYDRNRRLSGLVRIKHGCPRVPQIFFPPFSPLFWTLFPEFVVSAPRGELPYQHPRGSPLFMWKTHYDLHAPRTVFPIVLSGGKVSSCTGWLEQGLLALVAL